MIHHNIRTINLLKAITCRLHFKSVLILIKCDSLKQACSRERTESSWLIQRVTCLGLAFLIISEMPDALLGQYDVPVSMVNRKLILNTAKDLWFKLIKYSIKNCN